MLIAIGLVGVFEGAFVAGTFAGMERTGAAATLADITCMGIVAVAVLYFIIMINPNLLESLYCGPCKALRRN